MAWEILDVAALMQRQQEATTGTTSANAGPYERPLGPMLKRTTQSPKLSTDEKYLRALEFLMGKPAKK